MTPHDPPCTPVLYSLKQFRSTKASPWHCEIIVFKTAVSLIRHGKPLFSVIFKALYILHLAQPGHIIVGELMQQLTSYIA